MMLVIEHLNLAKPGMRAMHFAPDVGISRRLRKMIGSGYEAYDIDPKRYPGIGAIRFDLVAQAETLSTRTYDLIVHSHVMEHLLGNYTAVLYHLHRALTDNGVHIFCIPIISGYYASDLAPLSEAERQEEFLQYDHVRRFGRQDLVLTLGMIFNLPEEYDLTKWVPIELLEYHNVPPNARQHFTPDTIFVMRKNDIKLKAP
jgi:phosphoglycolate phosphatase